MCNSDESFAASGPFGPVRRLFLFNWSRPCVHTHTQISYCFLIHAWGWGGGMGKMDVSADVPAQSAFTWAGPSQAATPSRAYQAPLACLAEAMRPVGECVPGSMIESVGWMVRGCRWWWWPNGYFFSDLPRKLPTVVLTHAIFSPVGGTRRGPGYGCVRT